MPVRAKQISSDLLEERRRRERLEQQNKVLAAQVRARQMLACEAAALAIGELLSIIFWTVIFYVLFSPLAYR